jgi:hypothetical protein
LDHPLNPTARHVNSFLPTIFVNCRFRRKSRLHGPNLEPDLDDRDQRLDCSDAGLCAQEGVPRLVVWSFRGYAHSPSRQKKTKAVPEGSSEFPDQYVEDIMTSYPQDPKATEWSGYAKVLGRLEGLPVSQTYKLCSS